MTQSGLFLIGDIPGFTPHVVPTFGSGQKVNNCFKWFHVIGHEINHRGQILWLRRRATALGGTR